MGYYVIHRLLGVDVLVLLIDVGELDSLSHLECSSVSLLQSHDKAEEGCLTGSVGTDDAHDTVGRKIEVEVAEEHLLAERLLHMLCLDNLVAKARTIGDEYLEFLLALLLLLVEHLLVGVKTRLALGLTGLGSHAHPLKLALKSLATLAGRLLLLFHSLGLLVEP